MQIQASVLEQLKTISNILEQLETYEIDVSTNDLENAIFFSKINDQIKQKIEEIE